MIKKTKELIFILLFIAILFTTVSVYASSNNMEFKRVDFSESYKKWLEMSEDEKEGLIEPRMYDIPIRTTTKSYKSPFRFLSFVGSDLKEQYSLTDEDAIPQNVIVRDQGATENCWAFTALSSLETNLAIRDLKARNSLKQYNFSEKHMDYALVSKFYDENNNEIRFNKYGANRNIKETGNTEYANSYLTNGMGAVSESNVPYDYTNEDLNSIFSYKAETQVYDTILFPAYDVTEDLSQLDTIKNQIKEHIVNYGSVSAEIYMPGLLDTTFYNNSNGALYCNDITKGRNHAVSIIGWDNSYSKDNFTEYNKPRENGAWIVRNSWGEKIFWETFTQFKQDAFDSIPEADRLSKGWEQPEDIDEEFLDVAIINAGLEREGDNIYCPVGNGGFMYISYEDANIYSMLFGVVKADDKVSYENIYQYNETNSLGNIEIERQKTTIANKFEKQTENDEYITEVGIFAPEEYTCKVFINPDSDELDESKLQHVMLESGATQTVQAGYHTLILAEPVKINSDKFVVAIEITGKAQNSLSISIEVNPDCFKFTNETEEEKETINYVLNKFKYTIIETGKCYILSEDNEWADISRIIADDKGNIRGDSTIKAFTISREPDHSIDHIEITNPPKKTEYTEGDEFDTNEMEVKAFYNDGISNIVTEGYEIVYQDSSNKLKAGQTSIEIRYKGKSAYQPITVNEKVVVGDDEVDHLTIRTYPDKMIYWEGENFDPNGMIVDAVYGNGTTSEARPITIVGGTNLTADNPVITIKFENATLNLPVTVNANPVVSLEITSEPTKTEYYEGEKFNKEGMVVKAVYKNGNKVEISDYEITNGDNLNTDQNSVEIKYNNIKVYQAIIVDKVKLVGINIKTQPTKTNYYEGEDFNPNGMVVEAVYKNGKTVEIDNYELSDDEDLYYGQTAVTVEFEGFEESVQIKVIRSSVESIRIEEEPKKLDYKEDEDFDSEGMVVIAVYDDGKEEEIQDYDIIDGDSLSEGQDTVTISYKGKTATVNITVTKEEGPDGPDATPEPSNFDNMNEKTKMVKGYYYSNKNKKEYVLIDIELTNISQFAENDGYEYYYYVSSKSSEKNIDSWIKVPNLMVEDGKLVFTLDTRDMTNFDEIQNADNLYIYVKEIAFLGDEKAETITRPIEIKTENVPAEVYMDDVLVQEYQDISKGEVKVEPQKEDKTIVDRVLPNTGSKIVFAVIMIMLGFTVIRYIKYRKLKEIR